MASIFGAPRAAGQFGATPQVVLTGAFRELPPSCVEYISNSVRQHAMWARFGEISIRTAPRRRQAGMVSAALDSILLA